MHRGRFGRGGKGRRHEERQAEGDTQAASGHHPHGGILRVARWGNGLGEECGIDRRDLPDAVEPSGPPASPPGHESVRDRVAHLRERAERRKAGSKPGAKTRPRSPPCSRLSSGTPSPGEACSPRRWRSASSCSWFPMPSSWSPGSGWPRRRPGRIPETPPGRLASAGCSPPRSPAPAPLSLANRLIALAVGGSPWRSRRARSSGSSGSSIG